jgi:ubiquinone/menaquinone biosynthesis C-methylase UbiE
MKTLSKQKREVMEYMDAMAPLRDGWVKKNRYYYDDLLKFLRFNIPEDSSVLEIGCGTSDILNGIKPLIGLGIDISSGMINIARQKYPHLKFVQMDAEHLSVTGTFNYIIISDTLGYFEDIQKVFMNLRKVSTPDTRIIITYHNFMWQPFLEVSEYLKLKMPQRRLNWLNRGDIINLLILGRYEIIRTGNRFLLPKTIPVLVPFFNTYLSQLPLVKKFNIVGFIIAKPLMNGPEDNKLFSVSVIIPARNEKGNIEDAVRRIPEMRSHTEIIFVEGDSTDGTLDEIKRVCEKYSQIRDVKYLTQEGKGKGDAVRKGFDAARGDILMILDADLTVEPEQLPKFYNAIATGKGEFVIGSRLVYPMEDEAMRILNILGNKFFSLIFTFLLEQLIKDTLCGTKVLTKKNYERLIINRDYFGDFDPFGDFDLIFGAAKLNLKFIEIPIRYKSRQYGMTNISRFRHGWLLLKMSAFAMSKIKFI